METCYQYSSEEGGLFRIETMRRFLESIGREQIQWFLFCHQHAVLFSSGCRREKNSVVVDRVSVIEQGHVAVAENLRCPLPKAKHPRLNLVLKAEEVSRPLSPADPSLRECAVDLQLCAAPQGELPGQIRIGEVVLGIDGEYQINPEFFPDRLVSVAADPNSQRVFDDLCRLTRGGCLALEYASRNPAAHTWPSLIPHILEHVDRKGRHADVSAAARNCDDWQIANTIRAAIKGRGLLPEYIEYRGKSYNLHTVIQRPIEGTRTLDGTAREGLLLVLDLEGEHEAYAQGEVLHGASRLHFALHHADGSQPLCVGLLTRNIPYTIECRSLSTGAVIRAALYAESQ